MIHWPSSQEEQTKLLRWAQERIGFNSILYPVAAAVKDKAGKLLAVGIYHEYRKTDVQFSLAADSPRWATRGNLIELASYPFAHLGVLRMTAMTDKSNKKARRILEFCNFKLEGVLRDATKDGPLCIYGMTRTDFSELSKRHATKQTQRAAEAKPLRTADTAI